MRRSSDSTGWFYVRRPAPSPHGPTLVPGAATRVPAAQRMDHCDTVPFPSIGKNLTNPKTVRQHVALNNGSLKKAVADPL